MEDNQIVKLGKTVYKIAKGQEYLYEAFKDFIGTEFVEEVKEQVKQEMVATKMEIKQEMTTEINKQNLAIEQVKENQKIIPIDRKWRGELNKAKRARIFKFTGSAHTPKHDLFFGKYISYCNTEFKEVFGGLDSIQDVTIDEFNAAMNYVKNWTPSEYHTAKALSDWKKQRDVGKLSEYHNKILEDYIQSTNKSA